MSTVLPIGAMHFSAHTEPFRASLTGISLRTRSDAAKALREPQSGFKRACQSIRAWGATCELQGIGRSEINQLDTNRCMITGMRAMRTDIGQSRFRRAMCRPVQPSPKHARNRVRPALCQCR